MIKSISILILFVVSLSSLGIASNALNCDVKIAVLDTGIEATHEQFYPGQVVAWKDFVDVWFTSEPRDDHGHGTATASLVAGKTLGTFPGAKLVVGKVLDSDGTGSWADVQDGIRWAIKQNVSVISLSLGGLIPSTLGLDSDVDEAVEEAYRKNITVVVAAGNQYAEPSELVAIGYSPYSFVAGAADVNKVPAYFSNLDPEIVANGVDVYTAYLGNSYTIWSGTSFSTPQIAGWIGQMYNRYCGLITPNIAENAIKSTAKDSILPYTKEGHGFVNQTSANIAIERAFDPSLKPEISNAWYNYGSDMIRYVWITG